MHDVYTKYQIFFFKQATKQMPEEEKNSKISGLNTVKLQQEFFYQKIMIKKTKQHDTIIIIFLEKNVQKTFFFLTLKHKNTMHFHHFLCARATSADYDRH